jgi:uncharacterized protein
MVEQTVSTAIRRYLRVLAAEGIHAKRAILYGSFARGEATEESDIDLVVIAPEFDGERNSSLVRQLWRLRSQADIRIEPIPCGEVEWENEGGRPILDMARQDGVEILAGSDDRK